MVQVHGGGVFDPRAVSSIQHYWKSSPLDRHMTPDARVCDKHALLLASHATSNPSNPEQGRPCRCKL